MTRSNPDGFGAAIDAGTLDVQSCTFSGNSIGIRAAEEVTVSLSNSIVAGNTNPNDIRGPLTVASSITSGTAAQAGLETLNGAPVLKENGGPTPTINLVAGGQALNAGNTALSIDQRGLPRPLGGADDIGAVEFVALQSGASLVVTSSSDTSAHDGGGCTEFDCTLREAIAAANANTTALSVAITFSATAFTTHQTIVLPADNGLPAITRSLSITAPPAGVTIGHQNVGGGVTSTKVSVSNGAVLLSGLTISGVSTTRT